jgi:hypothetical protein
MAQAFDLAGISTQSVRFLRVFAKGQPWAQPEGPESEMPAF